MRFTATLQLHGKTATGIEVPAPVVEALGGGRKPAVQVQLGERHGYRTTIGVMGGKYLIPVAAEHRAAAGLTAGDTVEVSLELDDAPRDVVVPDDLAAALTPEARAFLDGLSSSYRKEWVRWIEDAKKPETRTARIAKAAEGLAAGRKTH